MLWIIPALYLFFITCQQPILNSKNNFHNFEIFSRWMFLIQIKIDKQKCQFYCLFYNFAVWEIWENFGKYIGRFRIQDWFLHVINKTLVLTFFGWNLEKNHSAFLLGLRKTVRTTAFYSTLHTEHLPMSHWGSSFFSSCSNLKCHYIFSWFCIFIVTVSTNNLTMIKELITGALVLFMLLFSSKFKLTNH